MVFFWKRISDGLFGQRWWLCAPHQPPCFCSRVESETAGDDGMIHRSPLLLGGCWWQRFRCETHPRHPNGVGKIGSLTPRRRGHPPAASQKARREGGSSPQFPGTPPVPGLPVQKRVGCVSGCGADGARGLRCRALPAWRRGFRGPGGAGQEGPGRASPARGQPSTVHQRLVSSA